MKPASFQYFSPKTVEEVLESLEKYGLEAKLLAGGQSLIPTLNFRLAQPAVLIDLNNVSSLSYIQADKKGGVRIGAMTRHSTVEHSSLIAERVPLLHETMPHIAYIAIRNRGTIGGSLVHSDPAAELPAVMVSLQAQFHVRSKKGDRWIAAKDFFLGLFTTALEHGEILEEILIPPMLERTGCSFQEISRQQGDFALVGVATVLTLDKKEKCKEARITLLGVGERPISARKAIEKITGQTVTSEMMETVAQIAAQEDINPSGDLHASADYRRHLARVLVKRTLQKALERALVRRL